MALAGAQPSGAARRRAVTSSRVRASEPTLALQTRFDDVGSRPVGRGSVFFDAVELPAAAMVGKLGEGFTKVMQGFDLSRFLIALQCVAAAQASVSAWTTSGSTTSVPRLAARASWLRFEDIRERPSSPNILESAASSLLGIRWRVRRRSGVFRETSSPSSAFRRTYVPTGRSPEARSSAAHSSSEKRMLTGLRARRFDAEVAAPLTAGGWAVSAQIFFRAVITLPPPVRRCALCPRQ